MTLKARGAVPAPGRPVSSGAQGLDHLAARRCRTTSLEEWGEKAVAELLELYFPGGQPSPMFLELEAALQKATDQLLDLYGDSLTHRVSGGRR